MRSGFLVVDKAPGTRSSRCVNIVKKIFSGKLRVGHGGTLDSTASGVLVVLVGKATRVSQYVMMLPKVYSVTAKFGMRSDTDDHSGKILSVCGTGIPDDHAIDRALLSFSGLTDQVPPQYPPSRSMAKELTPLQGKAVRFSLNLDQFLSIPSPGSPLLLKDMK